MENLSEAVSSSMQDIHRALKEARRQHGLAGRPRQRQSPTNVESLIVEIDRLSSVLKSVANSYEQLAEKTIEDPFSREYEDVLLQQATVKNAIAKAQESVKLYRNQPR